MALLVLMSQARSARRATVRDRPEVASEERWPMATAIIVWSLVSAVAWGGAIAAAIALF
jgi:hypothetical protein